MNLFDWVEWADSLLKAYPLLNDKQKETFSFVLEGRALVEELALLMNTIRVVQKLLKDKGLSSKSSKDAIALIEKMKVDASGREKGVYSCIISYIKEETALVPEGMCHNISSDIIESYFGWQKYRMASNKHAGFTASVLYLPLRSYLQKMKGIRNFNIKGIMENTKKTDMAEWCKVHLSPSKLKLRKELLRKSA